MSTADIYVRARIDTVTKERASDALEAMGLSISDAIRLLMWRIADEQRMPFDVKVPTVPNKKTKPLSELRKKMSHEVIEASESDYETLKVDYEQCVNHQERIVIFGFPAVFGYHEESKQYCGEFVGLNGNAYFISEHRETLEQEGIKSLRVFFDTCLRNKISPLPSSHVNHHVYNRIEIMGMHELDEIINKILLLSLAIDHITVRTVLNTALETMSNMKDNFEKDVYSINSDSEVNYLLTRNRGALHRKRRNKKHPLD